ncbi:type II toxin-antitoxin system VapC family toxin [Singulisphaera sp. Ch08]|uniref:Ribonuclease VapC n=1 Tax=Singulisphaera sp. Ch08 TaxID=3120278 RepID=A0AAU7CJQ8_9BACT
MSLTPGQADESYYRKNLPSIPLGLETRTAVRNVVVDASVGVKWYLPEIHSNQALLLLDDAFHRHVPAHFAVEIASAVWKRVVTRSEIEPEEGQAILDAIGVAPLVTHATADLLDATFALAVGTRRSVYDCLYLALAIHLQCQVVTVDEKFYHAIKSGPFAIHIVSLNELFPTP